MKKIKYKVADKKSLLKHLLLIKQNFPGIVTDVDKEEFTFTINIEDEDIPNFSKIMGFDNPITSKQSVNKFSGTPQQHYTSRGKFG